MTEKTLTLNIKVTLPVEPSTSDNDDLASSLKGEIQDILDDHKATGEIVSFTVQQQITTKSEKMSKF